MQENNFKQTKLNGQHSGPILGPIRLLPDVSGLDSFQEEVWRTHPDTILIPIGNEVNKIVKKKVVPYQFQALFGL